MMHPDNPSTTSSSSSPSSPQQQQQRSPRHPQRDWLAPTEENRNQEITVKNFEQSECAVCLEHFVIEDPPCALPCQHVFHVHCLLNWRTRQHMNRARATCPTCSRRYSQRQTRLLTEGANIEADLVFSSLMGDEHENEINNENINNNNNNNDDDDNNAAGGGAVATEADRAASHSEKTTLLAIDDDSNFQNSHRGGGGGAGVGRQFSRDYDPEGDEDDQSNGQTAGCCFKLARCCAAFVACISACCRRD